MSWRELPTLSLKLAAALFFELSGWIDVACLSSSTQPAEALRDCLTSYSGAADMLELLIAAWQLASSWAARLSTGTTHSSATDAVQGSCPLSELRALSAALEGSAQPASSSAVHQTVAQDSSSLAEAPPAGQVAHCVCCRPAPELLNACTHEGVQQALAVAPAGLAQAQSREQTAAQGQDSCSLTDAPATEQALPLAEVRCWTFALPGCDRCL